MKYYKYKWNESRGDEYDYFGTSTWYFEVGDDDYISRQIVRYEIGLTFKYSVDFQEDEFGGMGYIIFKSEHYDSIEVLNESFDHLWIDAYQPSVQVDSFQYELFEKYSGELDLLKDFRT